MLRFVFTMMFRAICNSDTSGIYRANWTGIAPALNRLVKFVKWFPLYLHTIYISTKLKIPHLKKLHFSLFVTNGVLCPRQIEREKSVNWFTEKKWKGKKEVIFDVDCVIRKSLFYRRNVTSILRSRNINSNIAPLRFDETVSSERSKFIYKLLFAFH